MKIICKSEEEKITMAFVIAGSDVCPFSCSIEEGYCEKHRCTECVLERMEWEIKEDDV